VAARTDVALVFPPLWHYFHIPPELVALAAQLRVHGESVLPLDLNQAALDYFLSAPYLRRMVGSLRDEAAILAGRDVAPTAIGLRRSRVETALAGADSIVGGVEDARRLFRDPARFYDLAAHRAAANLLHGAWGLTSAVHAPTELGFSAFQMRYNEQSLPECLAAARDRAQNPSLDFLEAEALPRLLDADPAVIALIYVHPDQIIPLFTLVDLLRQAGSRAHVTVLGSLEDQVSFIRYLRAPAHPDYAQLFALVDSVIVYEADEPLVELVEAVQRGGAVAGVPNLVYYQDGGLVFPRAPRIADVNALPTPDYTDIPIERYWFPEPVFALLSSRGCYWDVCSFCAIKSNQLSYRYRRVERMVDDLAGLAARHGVRWFHFRDMLMSPAYLRRFSLAIRERGLDARWMCRARFEAALTRDILEAMAAAGCRQVWFGLESANARVLGLMQKGTDLSVIGRILRDCQAVGIGAHMLTMHGFPTETPAEAEDTVAFLEAHADLIDAYSYSDFVLFSETDIFERPDSYGVTPQRDPALLLQYRFPHRTPLERVQHYSSFLQRKARVNQAIPMTLLHESYVSLYRERLGPGSWRPALVPAG
jgi:anaerobic magnesium-protoporphyrin IX monomethyl ester cyclase